MIFTEPLSTKPGLPKNLHAHVVDELGARIVRGDYATDAALPIEELLASELGVSRTVVREAVKVLAQKRLIHVRPRTGTRVCAPELWNQLDPDILRWRFAGEFDPKLVADVVDLRRIIEPAGAELAATRATPQQLETIAQALQEMTQETKVEAHIAADLRFHLGILDATNNELLRGFRHSLAGALGFAIRFTTLTKDHGRSTLSIHAQVYEAIKRKQPKVARAAMEQIVFDWADESLAAVAERTQPKKRKEKTKSV
jgi:DNA-binding FadR family transcriptional regulator